MKERFQGEAPPEAMSGQVAAQIAAAGKFVVQVYKGANEAIQNSAALQDDDHLFASLGGSKKYWFLFLVFVDPAAIGGMTYTLGGTVTVTNLIAFNSIAGIDLISAGRITALGETTDIGGSPTAVILHGTIETNTAGTLRFRWAQAVADNVGPTTVLRGSLLTYQEI